MMRCTTCKHWLQGNAEGRGLYSYMAADDYGGCAASKVDGEPNIHIVMDGADADLVTHRDFGCVNHALKAAE